MLLDKLKEVEQKYVELGRLLGDPKLIEDRSRYQKYAREYATLEQIVNTYRELKRVESDIEESKRLLEEKDEELRALAKEELSTLEKDRAELTRALKLMLLPKDPNDERNIILEIRAGAGGEESAIFAAELFRMYTRYAERRGWAVEILSANTTGLDGYKEVIAMIKGRGAYSRFKYESGVHRVQRVPATESSGRIHTSTVTVAILPEAEDVEVEIKDEEIRIDTYRASGHGGQNVNKVETAVRITHLPTGMVVTCQDEKSQHKNREKAMKILRSRLYDMKLREQQQKIASERRQQVGTGERSEKIRTYNFPQNRVTDHRIGLTLYKLSEVLDGELDELTDALIAHYQTEELKRMGMDG